MTLTDEQILGIINRYAIGVANANQKEPGFAIRAMRMALSDYWPNLDAERDQIIQITTNQCLHMFRTQLAAALGIHEGEKLSAEYLLSQVKGLKNLLDQVQPELETIQQRLQELEKAKK